MKHYTTRTHLTGLTSHIKGTTLCTQTKDVTIYDILKGNVALPSDNGTKWPTSEELEYLRYLKSQMSLPELLEAAAKAKDSEESKEQELQQRYLAWMNSQASEEAATQKMENTLRVSGEEADGKGQQE